VTREGRIQGLTLPELLITLFLVALLYRLGAGFGDFVERHRNFMAQLELRRELQYARAQAVTRETPVTLCALDSRERCRRSWQGGDIGTFIDYNGNHRLDPGEALRRIHWPAQRGRVEWRAALGRRYLVFKPGGDTAQNGSFLICRRGRSQLADTAVVVNRGGRAYVDEARGRRCA